MLRSSAKNHEYVGVVCDPRDYAQVLAEITGDERFADVAEVDALLRDFDATEVTLVEA